MKYYKYLLIILMIVMVSCKQEETTQVFVSGTDGHKSYRIPAIIALPDGTLPAFSEGRVRGSADFGDVNIVMKRSTDNGKTWKKMSTIVDYDSLQAGNPAPVTDLTDPEYPEGRIFLFYNTGNNHEGEVRKGNGYREFFTDDHGKTFSPGQTLNLPGSNEATAAEISGGRLMLNARNQKGDFRARIVAISNDGGESWDNQFFDNMLPDPVCQGSILNIGEYNGRSILAFSNPADTTDRNNLTLRISYDDGESWPTAILVDKSDDPEKRQNFTAYSDIVLTKTGLIGILYERDNYKEIVFKNVKWE